MANLQEIAQEVLKLIKEIGYDGFINLSTEIIKQKLQDNLNVIFEESNDFIDDFLSDIISSEKGEKVIEGKI